MNKILISEAFKILKGRLKMYLIIIIGICGIIAIYTGKPLWITPVIFVSLLFLSIMSYIIAQRKKQEINQIDKWLMDSASELLVYNTAGPIRDFIIMLKGRLKKYFDGEKDKMQMIEDITLVQNNFLKH